MIAIYLLIAQFLLPAFSAAERNNITSSGVKYLAESDYKKVAFANLPRGVSLFHGEVEQNGSGQVWIAYIDLNEDGIEELIVSHPDVPAQAGYYQFVYQRDGDSYVEIGNLSFCQGVFVWKIINGYHQLLTYNRNGAHEPYVYVYENGRYRLTK